MNEDAIPSFDENGFPRLIQITPLSGFVIESLPSGGVEYPVLGLGLHVDGTIGVIAATEDGIDTWPATVRLYRL